VNLNNWAGDGAPPDDPGTAGLDSVTMGGKVIAGGTPPGRHGRNRT
jgi:hypothetical protein